MGFESIQAKFEARDRDLPKQRNILMRAIEQDLFNDENVLAVFYGGSIGNQNTDLYSDIDLRIVVKDEVFEEYRSRKKERAKKWGTVLFYEDFPWTTYSVAHYDSFIKVDTFYYKKRDLQPSVWLQHIKIVHDPETLAELVRQKSLQLSYSPTAEEVELWRTKFFAYVHEIYRRVMRNEIYYALSCLDNLRFSMATGWYMAKGAQPNTFGDWAKIEGKRSQLADWQINLLQQWHSSREEIFSVMKSIIIEFKKVHKELCEIVDIKYDQRWEETILDLVLK
ncbi:aminoglycoside 6-adenylyltransferase [Fictibacillus sp. b24]|uniref:aminoglycoside 6-adenylyltransferase n=1 Tax=Fictibacillus sp. b24 TaxID=3055863 RepID=UPI0025A15EFA|nr:aminoglycoside 6-adenylyltransferase [Fictibacillus sp. b24]MDM5317278.1 aminoglycoside 6-adenylyltransferase [Fictibacillus sp. b24]